MAISESFLIDIWTISLDSGIALVTKIGTYILKWIRK